ncbi:MAG: gliding motility-associated ABC transporter permease subunit GldF [Bacteroidales bacterium]|nr:MAG: gliding motility-associated ABC transporter permease subunit GldF [Bacteroidales bacterium]
MFAIFVKEVSGFFSSLSGYIAAALFLVINGLAIWVFPGAMNILDSGYSTLETLFVIAPWVFLFLVPAITMKTFAEEKKNGTIELLLTRPISDLNLVLGKYFASVLLVLLILIPSLTFFLSIYLLGSPVGNIDTGGTWGSFIGLFFLAAGYAAIGVFSSSFTDNQIVSFLLAIVISLFFFSGFESIASLGAFSEFKYFLVQLGINEHYSSMSRGVIDTRDVIYFACLSTFFIIAARIKIQSRKW